MLTAAVVSLAAVVEGLVRSGSGDAVGVAVVVLCVLVVMVSWALVTTVFARNRLPTATPPTWRRRWA